MDCKFEAWDGVVFGMGESWPWAATLQAKREGWKRVGSCRARVTFFVIGGRHDQARIPKLAIIVEAQRDGKGKVFKDATNLDNYPGLAEEAKPILKKCNGLPLAIVTIGGFLAKQPKTSPTWRKLNEHLSTELEMNQELGIIRTILMKSYDGLPYHLKSCFLYLSIFPEDYSISRRRLVHRWNAEGYSSEVRGKSMGEVVDSYFMELIDRSMILPVKEPSGSRKGISSCKLHDLREISISKAMEENLCFRMEEGCSLNNQGTVRHLAETNNQAATAIIKLSKLQHVRAGGPYNISSSSGDSYDEILFKVSDSNKLSMWMWTATLMDFCFSICGRKFMEEIEGDSNKRDLCTFYWCVVLPIMARLADPFAGIVVPRGIGKLKDLHTLGTVNISRGNLKAILQDIKRLTQLHKLAVTGINKKNCQEFCSTLAHLSRLESLSVCSWDDAGLRGCLDDLRLPPKNLQSLKLRGPLGKLPDSVAGLQNLVKLKLAFTRLTEADGTIQVLGKLPNLAILRLRYYSFKAEEPSCFTCCREALFPSLTVLDLGYLNGISSVEFQEGAAPRLELLYSNDEVSFSGLSSLRSLKEVTIGCHLYRPEWLEDVGGQLTRNPNKPVLKFREY
ncbi:hypothetical protein C2845_PM04G05510 [Panicum miliaceum]|uniref:Uncharacterized protein n=1 Tax=Panicum miliaceum TaxID=4540 RepID=A0A3L6QTY6_PANMI|nr:hypothetical protein C2845_PM04G05510 [Panicum miliaceum]